MRDVIVCSVDNITKYFPQWDLYSTIFYCEIVKEILNSKHNNIYIRIQFIDFLHHNVKIMNVSQESVCEHVCKFIDELWIYIDNTQNQVVDEVLDLIG